MTNTTATEEIPIRIPSNLYSSKNKNFIEKFLEGVCFEANMSKQGKFYLVKVKGFNRENVLWTC